MPRRYFYDTEFIESPCTIDLISIGIVDEKGSEYYAVSAEFDSSQASPFVSSKVLPLLPDRSKWIRRDKIRQGVLDFVQPQKSGTVELWASYCAYDHVVFCWLFGPMVDLPKGLPWFSHDIQQYRRYLHVKQDQLPKQTGAEHNALEDAKHVKEQWEFLSSYEQLKGQPYGN